MKKKDEKVYFNDQWGLMVVHFKAFVKTGDQEELHLFRVQVKKLRAMLELLDTSSAKRQLSKDLKPVRKIFKHCGEVRNAYINLQLGVNYQFKNEEFLLGQLSEIEKGTDEIKELAKQYLKAIKLSHRIIANDIKPVDNDAILQFYKSKLDQITNALDNLQFNDELHNARKQIKTLLYNRKIVHKALEGKLQINNEYLDKLQGLIGDWHDNILALELFSAAEMNYKPVITKIKRQDTRLKRSIAVLVQEFRKKAVILEIAEEYQH
ncbi:MAG TPA: CHAD domain-containing protein [Mucilaginibacter sp.]